MSCQEEVGEDTHEHDDPDCEGNQEGCDPEIGEGCGAFVDVTAAHGATVPRREVWRQRSIDFFHVVLSLWWNKEEQQGSQDEPQSQLSIGSAGAWEQLPRVRGHPGRGLPDAPQRPSHGSPLAAHRPSLQVSRGRGGVGVPAKARRTPGMSTTTARCPFGCSVCERRCIAAQPFNHRFDCCGQIAAHVIEGTGSRRAGREPQWRNVTNPMQSGYLTGPSKTRRAS